MEFMPSSENPRRRPSLAVTVGLFAACCVVGLSGCSSAHPETEPASHASGPQVIPFRPIAETVKTLEVPAADTAAPACLASDLSATTDGGGGAAGSWRIPVTITNTGAGCALDLTSTDFGFVGTDGTHRTFGAIQPALTAVPAPVLESGGTLKLNAGLSEACSAGAAVTGSVKAYLKFAGTAVALAGNELPADEAACVADPAPAGQVEQVDPQQDPTGPLTTLRATVAVPASAGPGSTMTYTVTLANPTTTAVPLTPYPVYSEMVNANGVKTGATYQLNCDGLSQIAPGKSATFQMMLSIPDTAPQGVAKLGWSISNGAAVGAPVTISK